MGKRVLGFIVVAVVIAFAVDIREGELWRVTMEITEGEVTYDKELYALAGRDNLLLMPGMIGRYTAADSGIVLQKFGSYAGLVNGAVDRTVSAHSINLFSSRQYQADDSTTSWTAVFERVTLKSTSPLRDFRGAILENHQSTDMVLFAADTVYDFTDGVCKKLLIVSKKNQKLEVRYENGELIKECIDLQKVDGEFAELDQIDPLIDKIVPLQNSVPANNLLEAKTLSIGDSLLSEYESVKLLQNFTYNNYGFLSVKTMRALYFLIEARFESITHELMFLLREYCQENRYTIENVASKVEKQIKRKGIALLEDDPDRITKGLFILYLREMNREDTEEQKQLRSLLETVVIHYRRDE